MNGRQRKFATTTICLVAYCVVGYEVRCIFLVLYFESSCDQALRYIARVWVCTGTKILIDTRLFRPKWDLPLCDLNGPIVPFVVCIGMCYTVVICWRRELRPEQKVSCRWPVQLIYQECTRYVPVWHVGGLRDNGQDLLIHCNWVLLKTTTYF